MITVYAFPNIKHLMVAWEVAIGRFASIGTHRVNPWGYFAMDV